MNEQWYLYFTCCLLQYDIESAKLNAYIMQKEDAHIDEQFDKLCHAAQSDTQNLSIHMKAFEYYVYEKKEEKARRFMHELKGMASEELLAYCQMEYDILIEKSTKYISKLQEDVKTMEGQQKAIMLYLLKLSHENNHNMQKAQEVELQLRTLRS